MGSVLFSNPSSITDFRTDNLSLLESYLNVSAVSDSLIWSLLLSAEKDAARQLRVFFEPTAIVPEDALQSELDALDADGTAYATEPAYDYDPNDWTADAWGYLMLRQKPVIRVDSVKFTYPNPTNDVLNVPQDWFRLDKKYGQLRFVPTGTMMGLGPLSTYMLQAMSGGRLIPNMLHIRYTAGLSNVADDYPDLISLVKRMAAMKLLKQSFTPQSGSISADGLSQSVSLDLEKVQDAIDNDLVVLRDSIHGVRLAVL